MKSFTINILGQDYQVSMDELEKNGAHGLCVPQKSLILLDKSLRGTDLQQTFLHECFHAVMCRTGARQSLSVELEEVIVDSIATFLTDHYEFKI